MHVWVVTVQFSAQSFHIVFDLWQYNILHNGLTFWENYFEQKFHIVCVAWLNKILYNNEGTIKCTTVSYFVWDVTVQYSAQQFNIVCESCQYTNVHNSFT
jgi:hypothetical protein